MRRERGPHLLRPHDQLVHCDEAVQRDVCVFLLACVHQAVLYELVQHGLNGDDFELHKKTREGGKVRMRQGKSDLVG